MKMTMQERREKDYNDKKEERVKTMTMPERREKDNDDKREEIVKMMTTMRDEIGEMMMMMMTDKR